MCFIFFARLQLLLPQLPAHLQCRDPVVSLLTMPRPGEQDSKLLPVVNEAIVFEICHGKRRKGTARLRRTLLPRNQSGTPLRRCIRAPDFVHVQSIPCRQWQSRLNIAQKPAIKRRTHSCCVRRLRTAVLRCKHWPSQQAHHLLFIIRLVEPLRL